jgi:FtsH-binding integral membrane protein
VGLSDKDLIVYVSTIQRDMVDTALIWIGALAVVALGSAGAFAIHYLQSSRFDHFAFGVVLVALGGCVELGMANGYLSETLILEGFVAVCAVCGFVIGVIGLRRSGRGFQFLNEGV